MNLSIDMCRILRATKTTLASIRAGDMDIHTIASRHGIILHLSDDGKTPREIAEFLVHPEDLVRSVIDYHSENSETNA